MKASKIYFIFIWIAFILNGLPNMSVAQVYDFPIKPGGEKWKALKDHDEMVIASQIKEDILKNIQTLDLLETCLTYPLMMDVFAHDSFKQGFELTYKSFNGYKELINRKDYGIVLFNKFKSILLEEINSKNNEIDRGYFTFYISVLEIMLAQQNFLNQLSFDEKYELLKIISANSKLKNINSMNYGAVGQFTLAYAAANVLYNLNLLHNSDNEIQKFADRMELTNISLINDIFSKTLLNTK